MYSKVRPYVFVVALCAVLVLGIPAGYCFESSSVARTVKPRRMIENNAFFNLGRDVSFKGEDAELLNEFQNVLGEQGVRGASSATKRFFGRLFGPKVTLQECDNIEGYDASVDALYIDVRNNRLAVYYTSKESCRRAFELLDGLYLTRGSEVGVRGCQAVDWRGEMGRRGSLAGGTTCAAGRMASVCGGVGVDAASRFMSRTELEGVIRRGGGSSKSLFLEVVNGDNWRLESAAFSLINPQASIYPANNKYYTASQINLLIGAASREKVTLIPVIDLFSDNKPFRELTGHGVWSVEGMRFVRRIIEEYAQNVQSSKICLGDASAVNVKRVDPQYIKFIEDLLSKNSLEWVR